MSRRLHYYYRSACGLCEEMLQELLVQQQAGAFELERFDIDADEELRQRYDHKVPVLTDPSGEEICHHFLDMQALANYFSTH